MCGAQQRGTDLRRSADRPRRADRPDGIDRPRRVDQPHGVDRPGCVGRPRGTGERPEIQVEPFQPRLTDGTGQQQPGGATHHPVAAQRDEGALRPVAATGDPVGVADLPQLRQRVGHRVEQFLLARDERADDQIGHGRSSGTAMPRVRSAWTPGRGRGAEHRTLF
jgi:hypothetical protein